MPRVHACDRQENYKALKEEFAGRVYYNTAMPGKHVAKVRGRAMYISIRMAILCRDQAIGSCIVWKLKPSKKSWQHMDHVGTHTSHKPAVTVGAPHSLQNPSKSSNQTGRHCRRPNLVQSPRNGRL